MLARVNGPADPLAATLLAEITPGSHAAAALLNLNAAAEPDETVAATQSFAADCPPGSVVVSLIRANADWAGARRLALLTAFTRHAALEWAPRRLRVNAIALCPPGPAAWNATTPGAGNVPAASATPADVARVAWFLLRTPSITGQLVRLAA